MLTLGLILVLGFSFTRLVVTSYEQRQAALASEYYSSGVNALAAGRNNEAVESLETALVYSHDNFRYRLKLTDALLASGQRDEALAQLRAFWEQRPGDAPVNLTLARLEAGRGQIDDAERYYNNAIEGVWAEGSDPVPQRIATRFELAEMLLRAHRTQQAENALLALGAVIPSSSREQGRLAELFLQNGDASRALSLYEAQLHGRYRPEALLGAGRASYAAGHYAAARRYLEEANPATGEESKMLARLERIEVLDPFHKNLSSQVKRERTVAIFQIALARLAGCGAPFAQALLAHDPPPAAEPAQWSNLASWAAQLAPYMTERKLRGRDDAIESAMRFAFQAESSASQSGCGGASVNDEALLLLAHQRMGEQQ